MGFGGRLYTARMEMACFEAAAAGNLDLLKQLRERERAVAPGMNGPAPAQHRMGISKRCSGLERTAVPGMNGLALMRHRTNASKLCGGP